MAVQRCEFLLWTWDCTKAWHLHYTECGHDAAMHHMTAAEHDVRKGTQ